MAALFFDPPGKKVGDRKEVQSGGVPRASFPFRPFVRDIEEP